MLSIHNMLLLLVFKTTQMEVLKKNKNKKNRLIFVICLIISYLQINAQTYTREEFNDLLQKPPYFTINKANYFISGVPTNETINENTANAKYQISFKQIITRNLLPWDAYMYMTYTQKSFWDIYRESLPFKEINFNPSLVIEKALFDKSNKLKGIVALSYEHESNGRDSIFSRSWDRVSLKYSTKVSKKTAASFKMWFPYKYDEGNPELLEYVGLGEVNFMHIIKKDEIKFSLMLRKGLNLKAKGTIRSRLFYRPFKNFTNQYFMLEWYFGQAESLIEYEETKSMLRIGYVVEGSEFKWFNGKKQKAL